MPDPAVAQALSIGCPVSAFVITPAAVDGCSEVLSRANRSTRDVWNQCDSFCDRREANRGDWVLTGIPARRDLLASWHHLSILDWIVVPVLRGKTMELRRRAGLQSARCRRARSVPIRAIRARSVPNRKPIKAYFSTSASVSDRQPLPWGARGPGFKSRRPDQSSQILTDPNFTHPHQLGPNRVSLKPNRHGGRGTDGVIFCVCLHLARR